MWYILHYAFSQGFGLCSNPFVRWGEHFLCITGNAMPFNGDNFICFKYFKDIGENSKNISRSTYIHVILMDQKYKVFKPNMHYHLSKRSLLGELTSPIFFSSFPCFGVDNLTFPESFVNWVFCFLSLLYKYNFSAPSQLQSPAIEAPTLKLTLTSFCS